jgi:hypothetical protein
VDIRVKQVGDEFQAIDESGSWTTEIGVPIKPVDSASLDCGQSLVARIALQKGLVLSSSGNVEATTRNQ